jgi:hypothetical protein
VDKVMREYPCHSKSLRVPEIRSGSPLLFQTGIVFHAEIYKTVPDLALYAISSFRDSIIGVPTHLQHRARPQ